MRSVSTPHSPAQVASLFLLVLSSVWAFGCISEKRKNEWRAMFRAMFRLLGIRHRQLSV
jgi:hypothetical protein